MNGVDAIVFTAGIGENDAHVRSEVIKGMTWFGCELDEEQKCQTRRRVSHFYRRF